MALPSEEATEVVKNRREVYGHPADVYTVWAKLIAPIIGQELTPMEASMMLLLLKVAREINARYPGDYGDNLIDICGYANVLKMVKEKMYEPNP